jgi:hypothetical protein
LLLVLVHLVVVLWSYLVALVALVQVVMCLFTVVRVVKDQVAL